VFECPPLASARQDLGVDLQRLFDTEDWPTFQDTLCDLSLDGAAQFLVGPALRRNFSWAPASVEPEIDGERRYVIASHLYRFWCLRRDYLKAAGWDEKQCPRPSP